MDAKINTNDRDKASKNKPSNNYYRYLSEWFVVPISALFRQSFIWFYEERWHLVGVFLCLFILSVFGIIGLRSKKDAGMIIRFGFGNSSTDRAPPRFNQRSCL